MKKLISIALLICAFSITALSQTTKAKWTEMEDFHTMIAATYHPAESGDMLPIKAKSEELAKRAVAWKNSTAPAGYDKAAITTLLQQLVKNAKEVDKLVKSNATDNVVKEKLSKLHDVFHQIMEKTGGEDHH